MPECLTKSEILLGSIREIDPLKTFACGQCFRWNRDSGGVYTGVAGHRAAKVFTRDDKVYIKTAQEDFETFWHDYFDLGLDYEAIRLSFDAGDYLKKCAEFGAGIRILHQDRWEALCSFILSQCNNIPRIKKIVETLCREFGDPIELDGETFYSFPTAQTLAALPEKALLPLKSGYRAEYIISAARSVASGQTDLDALADADTDTAMKALCALKGVGRKVASCAVLFGLGHMEAFPIDVWMKRALKEHFPENFDPKALGKYAGLAQQYIFYYARSGGDRADV